MRVGFVSTEGHGSLHLTEFHGNLGSSTKLQRDVEQELPKFPALHVAFCTASLAS